MFCNSFHTILHFHPDEGWSIQSNVGKVFDLKFGIRELSFPFTQLASLNVICYNHNDRDIWITQSAPTRNQGLILVKRLAFSPTHVITGVWQTCTKTRAGAEQCVFAGLDYCTHQNALKCPFQCRREANNAYFFVPLVRWGIFPLVNGMCIFNKLEQWASTIVIGIRITCSTKAGVWQNNCSSNHYNYWSLLNYAHVLWPLMTRAKTSSSRVHRSSSPVQWINTAAG